MSYDCSLHQWAKNQRTQEGRAITSKRMRQELACRSAENTTFPTAIRHASTPPQRYDNQGQPQSWQQTQGLRQEIYSSCLAVIPYIYNHAQRWKLPYPSLIILIIACFSSRKERPSEARRVVSELIDLIESISRGIPQAHTASTILCHKLRCHLTFEMLKGRGRRFDGAQHAIANSPQYHNTTVVGPW